MQRKKMTHDIMRLYHESEDDFENALSHKIERDSIDSRILEFSKSPYKALTQEQLEQRLAEDEEMVLCEVYGEISSMVKDKDYKPCEDCTCSHEIISGKRLDLTSNIYCAYHPEWPANAGQTKAQEILECRKTTWRDYYERKPEYLIALKEFMKDIFNITDVYIREK